jgi:hypothetical protein
MKKRAATMPIINCGTGWRKKSAKQRAKIVACFGVFTVTLLTVVQAKAEMRRVGGYGLTLCNIRQTNCVRLSTGTEIFLTGNIRRDPSGRTLYEAITTNGAAQGWFSERERDTEAPTSENSSRYETDSCNGEPRVGMSEQEVLKTCWGKPKYRRRVGVEGLMRDEWVYGDGKYVYFDEGHVLATQQ